MTFWPNLSHNCSSKLHRQLAKTNADADADADAESVATVNKMPEDESSRVTVLPLVPHLIGAVATTCSAHIPIFMMRVCIWHGVWSMTMRMHN